ncbi:MAG: ABC transporter ATP-binding protein/permease [Bacteroidia bacterium]|nr:ABC transporter ATP-binding protein/permease [Bacteroidia bacterium]
MSTTPTPHKTTVAQAVREIVRPRWKQIAGGIALILISRAAGLVAPAAPQYILDKVLPSGDTGLIWQAVSVIGLALIVQAVSSFFLVKLVGVEAQKMIAELRSKVQQHILRLPIRFFDSQKTGNLVSRIMTDVEGIRNLVGTGLVQLFGGVLTSIGALVIMLSYNVPLTLALLVPLILFAFLAVKAFARIRPIFRERGKIQAEVTGRLTESLGGIRVVKGFHAETVETRVFEEGAMALFRNVASSMTATALVTSGATLMIGLSTLGAVGYAAIMIMEGTMTPGQLTSMLLYLGVLVFPIVQMGNIGSQITEAFAGLDRTQELLAMTREGEETDRTHLLKDLVGDIRFADVAFGYEKGKEVIHGVSFDAPAGSVTALVGSSGSGKTTIAGLAASFLKPDKGSISVDGVELSTVQLDSYRQHLGVVLQDDFLFEGTIRDNILFSRPDATEEQLQQAIDAAYVSEFTDRFDEGLQTLIGERGVKLSGGQRQRIAIARAILADPKVLILDEATSNLDAESEAYIQQSLEKLLAGRTTFVIAHRLSTIRRADQILVVEDGVIVERGTHDDLILKDGRYSSLYKTQSRI